jgi:hypothetical protein
MMLKSAERGRFLPLPWATFSRRPNEEGLVGPLGRRSPISTHHGGAHPRRPLLRVRSDHDIPDWVAAWSAKRRPSN